MTSNGPVTWQVYGMRNVQYTSSNQPRPRVNFLRPGWEAWESVTNRKPAAFPAPHSPSQPRLRHRHRKASPRTHDRPQACHKPGPSAEPTATSAAQLSLLMSTNTERKDSVLFLNILSKEAAWYVFVKDGCHPNSLLLYFYKWYRLRRQINWGFKSQVFICQLCDLKKSLPSLSLGVCRCKMGV